MASPPGALRVLVLAQAAIGIVDAAMQGKFGGTGFEFFERILAQQRDRTVVELPPAQGVDVAEQTGSIVIPTPPQVTGQSPEPLPDGRDETVERTGFAHHMRNPIRGLRQLTDFILRKDSRLYRLNHQDALQHTPINKGNAQEGMVGILARFGKVLE